VTAWLTHGLLEASIGGNDKALPLLRGHMNWFNNNSDIPLFLPPIGGPDSRPNPDFSNLTSWVHFCEGCSAAVSFQRYLFSLPFLALPQSGAPPPLG
jgi:hypothetical protein